MARQIRTTEETTQVTNDENRFFLPLDSSLDVGAFTVYGTTDPDINLSMVNIRHLNATRSFRGAWSPTPTDGAQPTPYLEGQVVIGSDSHMYVRSDFTLDQNPDPVGHVGNIWSILSSGLDQPVTELTSTPESFDANLFAAGSTTFQIAPSADASLLNPMTTTTTANVAGTPTTNLAGQVLTVNYAAQTNDAAVITVTTDARSDSFGDIHEGGQVDSTINFVDARQDPVISPEVQRVSILSSPETAVYNVGLIPAGTSVAAGTAYDVQWRARQGTAMTSFSSAPTYTAAFPDATQDIVFEYQVNMNSIQTGTPDADTISLRVYTPWFYQFSDTVPTDITGATLALRQGETQADDFSTSNMIAPIAGTVGAVGFLYLFVPATMNQAITIGAGIARATGERLPADSNITVPNRNGTGNVVYALHRFRLGLAHSPTNFTITTA